MVHGDAGGAVANRLRPSKPPRCVTASRGFLRGILGRPAPPDHAQREVEDPRRGAGAAAGRARELAGPGRRRATRPLVGRLAQGRTQSGFGSGHGRDHGGGRIHRRGALRARKPLGAGRPGGRSRSRAARARTRSSPASPAVITRRVKSRQLWPWRWLSRIVALTAAASKSAATAGSPQPWASSRSRCHRPRSSGGAAREIIDAEELDPGGEQAVRRRFRNAMVPAAARGDFVDDGVHAPVGQTRRGL